MIEKLVFWVWFIDALIHAYIFAFGGYVTWASFFLTMASLLMALRADIWKSNRRKEREEKIDKIITYFDNMDYF